jgi:hypothetical protein
MQFVNVAIRHEQLGHEPCDLDVRPRVPAYLDRRWRDRPPGRVMRGVAEQSMHHRLVLPTSTSIPHSHPNQLPVTATYPSQ